MTAGFIYTLVSDAHPELIKIGRSTKHPEIRAAELSDHTGVPSPLRVAYFFEVSDHEAAEMAVHRALHGIRHSPNREFFRLRLAESYTLVSEAIKPWFRSESLTSVYQQARRDTPAKCWSCGKAIWYSTAARSLGGYCPCGAGFNPVFEPDSVPTTRHPEALTILPRCPKCRQRMFFLSHGLVQCSACAHMLENWE